MLKRYALLGCFIISACSVNRLTKHSQKKGRWVKYNTSGQIEQVEYYRARKIKIDPVVVFQLGWTNKDSIVYGQELVKLKRFIYDSEGNKLKPKLIDTSFISLPLLQMVKPYNKSEYPEYP